jgi:biopolymer transport protein ExbD
VGFIHGHQKMKITKPISENSNRAFKLLSLVCVATTLLIACTGKAPYTTVVVEIKANKFCVLDATQFKCEEIGAAVISNYKATNIEVLVKADELTRYEIVGATIKSIQSAGIGRIRFENSAT